MRRRDKEREKEVFKKSKKVDLMPIKGIGVEMKDEIMEILKQLTLDVKDIKRKQIVYAEDLKELRAEKQKLKKENEAIRNKS
ncbi:unnamed protein product [Diabrotica balteata]|uniref:Uncharacterized protein n=1 Tax=Diabrotica balteata TaxID=107213 RepID=A0A9N9SR18_DIABA|nr:unnamed protein product [Diabrotica balteata]